MSVPRTATTTCRRTAISPRSWIARRRNGCPRRSLWWLLRTTAPRQGSGPVTGLGSSPLNMSSCTSSPAAATTSRVPVRPRRRRLSCSPPECWFLHNCQPEGSPDVVATPGVTARYGTAAWQASDCACRGYRRPVRLGGRTPGCVARRRGRARRGSGAWSRAARCRRDHRGLPAAGHHFDDGEGGVRCPAGLRRRGVLLGDLACEPADVHAP